MTPPRSSRAGSGCGPMSAPGRSTTHRRRPTWRSDGVELPKSYVLEMLPYPSGEPHIGHLKVLLGRRRDRPLPPPHGPPRAAPDGLRRVRPARREPRDQDGRAPARLDRRLDRLLPAPVPLLGHLDRLVARVRDPRAALLPLDAVDLPRAAEGGPGLPQGGGGQVVSQRRDGAGQRAGHRRPLRALRRRGRGAPARAVVPAHHRLRRPPARRPRRHRLARARQDDAAQLDRPLGGRRGRLPLRGAGDRLPGLHDAARHALRRDVLRDGPRAPRRAAPGRGHRARAGRARLRKQGPGRAQRGPR